MVAYGEALAEKQLWPDGPAGQRRPAAILPARARGRTKSTTSLSNRPDWICLPAMAVLKLIERIASPQTGRSSAITLPSLGSAAAAPTSFDLAAQLGHRLQRGRGLVARATPLGAAHSARSVIGSCSSCARHHEAHTAELRDGAWRPRRPAPDARTCP